MKKIIIRRLLEKGYTSINKSGNTFYFGKYVLELADNSYQVYKGQAREPIEFSLNYSPYEKPLSEAQQMALDLLYLMPSFKATQLKDSFCVEINKEQFRFGLRRIGNTFGAVIEYDDAYIENIARLLFNRKLTNAEHEKIRNLRSYELLLTVNRDYLLQSFTKDRHYPAFLKTAADVVLFVALEQFRHIIRTDFERPFTKADVFKVITKDATISLEMQAFLKVCTDVPNWFVEKLVVHFKSLIEQVAQQVERQAVPDALQQSILEHAQQYVDVEEMERIRLKKERAKQLQKERRQREQLEKQQEMEAQLKREREKQEAIEAAWNERKTSWQEVYRKQPNRTFVMKKVLDYDKVQPLLNKLLTVSFRDELANGRPRYSNTKSAMFNFSDATQSSTQLSELAQIAARAFKLQLRTQLSQLLEVKELDLFDYNVFCEQLYAKICLSAVQNIDAQEVSFDIVISDKKELCMQYEARLARAINAQYTGHTRFVANLTPALTEELLELQATATPITLKIKAHEKTPYGLYAETSNGRYIGSYMAEDEKLVQTALANVPIYALVNSIDTTYFDKQQQYSVGVFCTTDRVAFQSYIDDKLNNNMAFLSHVMQTYEPLTGKVAVIKGLEYGAYANKLSELPLNAPLYLEREVANRHDQYAVKIMVNGKKLGYISKNSSKEFAARLIQQGTITGVLQSNYIKFD